MSGQKEVKFFLKPPIYTGQHRTKVNTPRVAYAQFASVKQHLLSKLTIPFCTATESWFMVNGSLAQDSLVPWFLYHESLVRIPFKWSRLRITINIQQCTQLTIHKSLCSFGWQMTTSFVPNYARGIIRRKLLAYISFLEKWNAVFFICRK